MNDDDIATAAAAGWPVLASVLGAAALADRIITHHPVEFARRGDRPAAAVASTPGADVLDARGAVLASNGLLASIGPPMFAPAALIAGVYTTVHAAMALARTAERFEGARALDRAWRSSDPIHGLRDALVQPAAEFMPAHDVMHVAAACAAATLACGAVGIWIVVQRRRRAPVARNRARLANAAAWLATLALVAIGTAIGTDGSGP